MASLALSAACIAPATRDPRAVLERIAYGASPDDVARVRVLGADAFIEEQLDPGSIDDAVFEARLAGYPTLAMSLPAVVQSYGDSGPNSPSIPMTELVEAKILRAVYSKRQLEAILTDLWINHFHVRDNGVTLGSYERDAIRPHVLGRFEDLLVAVARAPAMAVFLDNVSNMRDGVVMNGVEKGINENFARELLELHTVGVETGYTQQDVVDLARIFTGWSVDWTRSDGFTYRDPLHDKGAKRVMGLTIAAGGGEEEGRAALAYLAAHPKTAERVARKLVRRFVDESEPGALVQAAIDTYRQTGGDLREVMRTILLSDAFINRAPRTKVKRPLVLVASALRALRMEIQGDVARYHEQLALLGEAPYAAIDPRGYADDSGHWLAPGTLLNRLQFMQVTAQRAQDDGVDFEVTGSEASPDLVAKLAARLVVRGFSRGSAGPIERFADMLLPSSPALRTLEVVGLVLSSPEFQFH
jgi:uncharacterized protein (DUF1800 family)